MKLNADKSKYMVVNFTEYIKFNTRLSLESKTLEEVNETRLLGVVMNNKLTQNSNTENIVNKAYKRKYGIMEIWKYRNMEIWKYGNLEIWKFGNM